MKKLKKIIMFSVLAVMLFALSVPAKADIIFEPYDDDFYNSHPDCAAEYLSARYLTKEDGTTVYKAPDSKKTTGKFDGNILLNSSVSYTFEDGTVWRYVEAYAFKVTDLHNGEYELLDSKLKGWIKDSELIRIYDSVLFQQDYADEIRAETAETPTCDEIAAYYYPNGDFCGKVQIAPEGMSFQSDSSYTDAYGREWAHVNYYMGWRDFWYCTAAPELTYDELLADAGVSEYPDPRKKETAIATESEKETAAQTEPETIGVSSEESEAGVGGVSMADEITVDVPKEKKTGIGTVICAVIGAAAGVGLALFGIRRKYKKEADQKKE